jgi:hypothetical protein
MLAQLTKDLFKFYATPAANPLGPLRLTSDATRHSVGYNVEIHGPPFIETHQEIISVSSGTHSDHVRMAATIEIRKQEVSNLNLEVSAVSPSLFTRKLK